MAEAGGQVVRITRIGALLEIRIAHPPVNALGPEVRRALSGALDVAERDNSAAVLLRGEGGVFSAGQDMAEPLSGGTAPGLHSLCDRIEAMDKPVVAYLSGAALGGGLELALAAHLRLADDSVQVALPDVHLGLTPCAGGTQRLPRLAGPAVALDLLLSGRVLGAAEALALGLVDRVLTGDPDAELRDAAEALVAAGSWQRTGDRRDGFRDPAAWRLAIDAAREAQRGQRSGAARRIVDCVEAALLLPYEQGLAFERAAHGDLAATPEAAGLRHAFRADRAARRLPRNVAAVSSAVPQRLSVWGTGRGAIAVVRAALQSGMAVQLAEAGRAELVAALEAIAEAQEADVAAGRMTASARDADWARLTPAVGQARLGEAEVVLTTRDDLALPAPRTVLALEVGPPKGGIAVTPLVAGPGLAELAILSPDVAPARAAQAVALARRIGWDVVPTGPGGPVAVHLATALAGAVAHLEGRGVPRALVAQALALAGIAGEGREGAPRQAEEVIARRCFGALANAGARLVDSGAARDAAQVDAIAIAAGITARWTGGPMHQADRRGLMVLRRDLRLWSVEAPELYAPSALFDRLIADGARLTEA